MAEVAGATPEAHEDPEAGSGGEEEVPEIPGPRSFVILQEDESFDLGYTVGSLDLDVVEGGKTCEVAAIAVIDGKLLVAVPEAVWNKAVHRRKLAARALTKPHLVAVASCLEDSRESDADIVTQLRVWVGFLHPELELSVEFLGASPSDYPFGEHGGHRTVPFAPALVEVANEHFNFFVTADSTGQGGEQDDGATARLDHLEAMMRDMKTGLDALLGRATGGATVLPTPKAGGRRDAGGNGPGKQSRGPEVAELRGLDPATVENALQAGIPAAHLREVGKIMKDRPKRLEHSRWSPVRVRRGGRRSSGCCRRRSWRRVWICRSQQCGEGHLGTDKDSWQAVSQQDQEGTARSSTGRRRCWVSGWKRRELEWGQAEQCSSSGADQMPEGEPQVYLRSHRKQSSVRLRIPADPTRRAFVSRDDNPWVAHGEKPYPELPEPREMGVASSWSLGCSHCRPARRSKSEMRFVGRGCRPGQHRFRQLADFKCVTARESTSLLRIMLPRRCRRFSTLCSTTRGG